MKGKRIRSKKAEREKERKKNKKSEERKEREKLQIDTVMNLPQLAPKNQPGTFSLPPFSPLQLDAGEERRMRSRDSMGQGEGGKITS